MKRWVPVLLAAACILFCGCATANRANAAEDRLPVPTEAAETPAPTHTPVPVATPRPIPELTFPDGSIHKSLERRLNLTEISHADVEEYLPVLEQMPKRLS